MPSTPLIRLNNEFTFPDLEPSFSKVLYGWSGIFGQFGLCSFMVSFITSSKLIIFLMSSYIVTFIDFLFTIHLLQLCSFHMHMFLLNQLIAFFYHQLNLMQSYDIIQ